MTRKYNNNYDSTNIAMTTVDNGINSADIERTLKSINYDGNNFSYNAKVGKIFRNIENNSAGEAKIRKENSNFAKYINTKEDDIIDAVRDLEMDLTSIDETSHGI